MHKKVISTSHIDVIKKTGIVKYKNFYFLFKNTFKQKENNKFLFSPFKLRKRNLYDEIITPNNERYILLKINKPSYLIDDIIVELYKGNVPNYELRGIIVSMFKTRNKWLIYHKSLFNIIEKTLKNIKHYRKRTNFWDYSFSLVARFLPILNNIIGKSVMDVGTGNGMLPLLIKKKYPYLDVYGSDICSLETINSLAKAEGLDISFSYLDITNIKDQKIKRYDTVVFSDVLEHFPKEKNRTLIANLLKLTRKRLIIHVPPPNIIQEEDHLQIFKKENLIKLALTFSSSFSVRKTKYSKGHLLIIERKGVNAK